MNTDWSLFGKKEQGQIIGGRKETKMKKKKKKKMLGFPRIVFQLYLFCSNLSESSNTAFILLLWQAYD